MPEPNVLLARLHDAQSRMSEGGEHYDGSKFLFDGRTDKIL